MRNCYSPPSTHGRSCILAVLSYPHCLKNSHCHSYCQAFPSCHFPVLGIFFFSASSPGPAEVLMQQSQRWLSPPETCLPAHLQSLLSWKLDHEKLRSPDPVLPAAGSSPSDGGMQVRLSSSLRSQILHLFLHSLVLGLHHMANPWSLHTLFKPFSLCLAQFPRTALLPLCSVYHHCPHRMWVPSPLPLLRV